MGPVLIDWSEVLQFDGGLDTGNWALRLNGMAQTITSATASGNSVVLTRVDGPVSPGPDEVSYSPPPYDVISAEGVPALGFDAYPVDMIAPR